MFLAKILGMETIWNVLMPEAANDFLEIYITILRSNLTSLDNWIIVSAI